MSNNETKKSSTLIVILVIAVCVLAIAVAFLTYKVVMLEKAQEGDKEPVNTVDTQDVVIATGDIPDEESVDVGLWGETVELDALDTPYIDFEFPAEWHQLFDIVDTETEDSYQIAFNGKDELEGFNLFTVYFGGGSEDAYTMGRYTSEGKTVDVKFHVNTDTEGFTDDQLSRINELQLYVNDLIIQLGETEGYTPIR